MGGAAMVIRRQNQIIRIYRDSEAVTPQTAASPEELGVRVGIPFHGLVRRGVLKAVGDGQYYLDEAAVQAFMAVRRTRMLIALVVVVLVAAFLLFRQNFL